MFKLFRTKWVRHNVGCCAFLVGKFWSHHWTPYLISNLTTVITFQALWEGGLIVPMPGCCWCGFCDRLWRLSVWICHGVCCSQHDSLFPLCWGLHLSNQDSDAQRFVWSSPGICRRYSLWFAVVKPSRNLAYAPKQPSKADRSQLHLTIFLAVEFAVTWA